jgi:hypothetical protein
MILVQIATALAIGAYVVLSKDAPHKHLDATPRESLRLQHPADHLLDRAGGTWVDPKAVNRRALQSAVPLGFSVDGK